jgi:hypothetical protein
LSVWGPLVAPTVLLDGRAIVLETSWNWLVYWPPACGMRLKPKLVRPGFDRHHDVRGGRTGAVVVVAREPGRDGVGVRSER